jgi:hypothetical protein
MPGFCIGLNVFATPSLIAPRGLVHACSQLRHAPALPAWGWIGQVLGLAGCGALPVLQRHAVGVTFLFVVAWATGRDGTFV